LVTTVQNQLAVALIDDVYHPGCTKIFSQRAAGEWIGTKVLNNTWPITANFSADGCHVVLACNDHSIRVYKTSFSADGRHIIVITDYKKARIFKLMADTDTMSLSVGVKQAINYN